MQRVTVVRYTTKPGRADENEALSRAVFSELRAKAPDSIGYAVFRQGQDFLHLFVNFDGVDAGMLVDLPKFKAFSQGGPDRWTAEPDIQRYDMALMESYGFDLAMSPA